MARLMTWRQIQEEKLPRSRHWARVEMRAGRFPEPVVPGHKPMWLESEIDKYLADRKRGAELQRKAHITMRGGWWYYVHVGKNASARFHDVREMTRWALLMQERHAWPG